MFRFCVSVFIGVVLLVGSARGDTTAADADFDGNGKVEIADFLAFVNVFGLSQGNAGYQAVYDLNGNGTIDIPDFLVFVDAFGKDVPPVKIYWADIVDWRDISNGKIRRANLDGSQVEDVITDAGGPDGIVLDASSGKVYWVDRSALKIRRANLDGSQIEDLITTGLKTPIEVVLDASGGKMYWIDHSTGKVSRANLDGSQIEDVVTDALYTHGLALDVSGGKMYWGGMTNGEIRRANLDGSQNEGLITGIKRVAGLTLDVSGGKMYWIDGGSGKVSRANLDGSQIEDLVTGLNNPRAVALDVSRGKMYWTHEGAKKIQCANLDGSQIEDVVTGAGSPRGIALDLARAAQPGGTTPPIDGSVEEDRSALIALYNATGGDNWTSKTNWLSDRPLGEWFGVSTNAQGAVVELSLNANNLDGSISAWPPLSKPATKLALSSSPLSNLVRLDLSNNQLSGAIPSALGNLSNLVRLDLSNNQLSGAIPSSFGNLSNLVDLYLSGNTGLSLPASLVTWAQSIINSDLTALLIGTVEEDRAVLVALYDATNGDNWKNNEHWKSDEPLDEWAGVITDSTTGRVRHVWRPGNGLSGSIPSSLSDLTRLVGLDLQHNELTGVIPSSLGNLARLEYLNLSNNQLTGRIPASLGKLTEMRDLVLSGNQLSGPLPITFNNLTNIRVFDVGDSVCMPDDADLQKWANDHGIELKACEDENNENCQNDRAALMALYNVLDPDWRSTEAFREWGSDAPLGEWIGVVTNEQECVVSLTMSALYISTPIPPELGNLSKLEELYLMEGFSGPIPPELGNLSNLEDLYLTSNEISGSIPPELGNLSNLEELYFAENPQLSGSIPSSLGNLSKLEYLDLWNNQLSGTIPSSLGNLSSLRYLDVHYTQLSGPVPLGLKGKFRFSDYSSDYHFYQNNDGYEASGLCFPSEWQESGRSYYPKCN